MSIKINGLKEVQEKLRKLARGAKELDGQSVPMSKIMTDEFVIENSSFASFNELLDASGFKVESKEDFEAIPDVEWDVFISKNTNFSSWEEMMQSAAAMYARVQLGL